MDQSLPAPELVGGDLEASGPFGSITGGGADAVAMSSDIVACLGGVLLLEKALRPACRVGDCGGVPTDELEKQRYSYHNVIRVFWGAPIKGQSTPVSTRKIEFLHFQIEFLHLSIEF